MNRRLRKIWICTDVWMDILPFFGRPQLGHKLALLSPRFDCLVDKHFDGKTELTLWRGIEIRRNIGPKARIFVYISGKYAEFPLPDHLLAVKIRFRPLMIMYIDHSVLEFLRSNRQIFDRSGTKLNLNVWAHKGEDVQLIWNCFLRQIWPIFASNIGHLQFADADHLANLRCRISRTILSDRNLISINSGHLFPDVVAAGDFDRPNAPTSAGQALSKWLYIPRKDGQPKRLCCSDHLHPQNLEWINNFKEAFLRATVSSRYKIRFNVNVSTTTPTIEPFELVNERTNEKLILMKDGQIFWLLKRCPIIGETAIQWEIDENLDANLNNVFFYLRGFNNSIGPLYSSSEFSSPAGPSSDQRDENV